MNILLLGATGRVGSVILKKALADGHQVVALVRSPEKIVESGVNLRVVKGNVLDKSDLTEAVEGQSIDIVLSALNTDKNNTLSKCAPLLIQVMNEQNISRIITIGTAGILDSRTEPNMYRFQTNESKRKSTTAAEDHLAAYHELKSSNLNWTIVCPTYLPEGGEQGNYRVGKNVLPENGKQITVGDTADFAYSQLMNHDYTKMRVGIAY